MNMLDQLNCLDNYIINDKYGFDKCGVAGMLLAKGTRKAAAIQALKRREAGGSI